MAVLYGLLVRISVLTIAATVTAAENAITVASINSTASSANHIDDSSMSFSRTTVFFCFVALAGNAVLQRSGADEFPCPRSLSPARVSPLMCLADIVVALMTLVYGFCNHLRLRRSSALYIQNSRRTVKEENPLIDLGRTIPELLVFVVAMFSGFKVLVAQGIPLWIKFWAVVFFVAPLIDGFLRMFAESKNAQEDVKTYLASGKGRTLLQVADLIWCTAYTVQFVLWIQITQGVVDNLSHDHEKAINVTIGCIIILAHAISWLDPRHLFKYWSLQNWDWTQWRSFILACFVLSLALGLPSTSEGMLRLRHNILVPLTSFGIVVLGLWFISVLMHLLDYASRRLRDERTIPAPPSLDEPVEVELSDRLSPLLSTAPRHWRQTLMIAFAILNAFFASLYFVFLYNDRTGSLPSWTEDLGE